MPRTRDIKPGFFQNEDLGVLPPIYRLMFAGMWCWADREGRLEDRPLKLKAEILPYDQCDGEMIIQALADNNLIIRYQANGTKYIQIINFVKHQNIHPKEPISKIPSYAEPSEEQISAKTVTRNLPDSDLQLVKNAIPSYTSFPSCEYNMSAPAGADATATPAGKPDSKGGAQSDDSGKGGYSEEFEEFWRQYPKRVVKKKAFKQWQARLKEKVKAEELIEAARRYAEECRQKGTEVQFIKHPATFLGGDRAYEDYIGNMLTIQNGIMNTKGEKKNGANSTNTGGKNSTTAKFDKSKFYA